MKIISQLVLMWAEFESVEALEQWVKEQSPRRVRIIFYHEDKEKVTAHLELELDGYPMYVSEA